MCVEDIACNISVVFWDTVYIARYPSNCLCEITHSNGYYAVQNHSRSPILVPIEGPYANNRSTNWHPLSHLLKFWGIIGKIFAVWQGVPFFNAVHRVRSLCSRLRKLAQVARNIAVLYAVKCISISWTLCQTWITSVTDGRTDRQTVHSNSAL